MAGRNELLLAGSAQDVQPLRLCQGRCRRLTSPGGGVQMSPTKWVCVDCWRSVVNTRRFTSLRRGR